jgi:hypothetical protein
VPGNLFVVADPVAAFTVARGVALARTEADALTDALARTDAEGVAELSLNGVAEGALEPCGTTDALACGFAVCAVLLPVNIALTVVFIPCGKKK